LVADSEFDHYWCSCYVLIMAAANASARAQRVAILASPLHELTGFYLAVDCLTPGCNGERTFAIAELASFYGRDCTVGEGAAPHALLEGLWRSRRGSVAGDGADPQCSGQTAGGCRSWGRRHASNTSRLFR
jgi:hypothetical protein